MPRLRRTRPVLAAGTALIVASAVAGLPAVLSAVHAAPAGDTPAYVCHDDGVAYVKADTAITGHLSGHRRDIVPPYSAKPAGVNWTAAGQAVWAADCAGDPAVVTTPPDKVAICHRTHATTNPYRRITVAAAAVDGAGASDHTQHSGVGSVFDPLHDYAPNAKIWDDVIPDATGGGIDPGLHWDLVGESLFASYCAPMTAQAFAAVELEAGRTMDEVAADILEQGAEGDPATTEEIVAVVEAAAADLGLTPTPSPTPDPTETSVSPDPTQTSVSPDPTESSVSPDPTETSVSPDPTETSVSPDPTQTSVSPEPTQTSATPEPSSTSSSAGSGRLRVLVFLDSDGDGVQGPDEPGLSGARIVLVGPGGTREVFTDAEGRLDVTDLPAGTWDVESAEVDGLDLTADSHGDADRLARVVIPDGGAARAWFGLRGPSALDLDVSTPQGPWSGVADVTWLGPDSETGRDDLGMRVPVSGGAASLFGVPAGTYDVSVGASSTRVVVAANGVGTAVLDDVADAHPVTGAAVLPLLVGAGACLLLGLALLSAGQVSAATSRRH